MTGVHIFWGIVFAVLGLVALAAGFWAVMIFMALGAVS